MQVILLADVKGVGKKGQVINASDGHAKNFLLPRKLAVEANDANMKALQNKKKIEEQKRQSDIIAAGELKKQIEQAQVKIKVKTGENGKLFGSVTNKEIAAELESQANISIDRKKIILAEAIKTKGEHTAEIKLYTDISAKLKFIIE